MALQRFAKQIFKFLDCVLDFFLDLLDGVLHELGEEGRGLGQVRVVNVADFLAEHEQNIERRNSDLCRIVLGLQQDLVVELATQRIVFGTHRGQVAHTRTQTLFNELGIVHELNLVLDLNKKSLVSKEKPTRIEIKT